MDLLEGIVDKRGGFGRGVVQLGHHADFASDCLTVVAFLENSLLLLAELD